MITGVGTKSYRPRSLDFNQRIRQQTSQQMSAGFIRALALMLTMVVIMLGAWSLFIHWQVASLGEKGRQLSVLLKAEEEKNISLRAIRAGMLSKRQVTKRAAERLHLVIPAKNQVHRF